MFKDYKYGRNLDVFNLVKALGTRGLLGACSWFQQEKKEINCSSSGVNLAFSHM